MADVTFDRNSLLDAFSRLGSMAWVMGKTVEIAVYGGSALMLSYDWRASTKDVDGVYEEDRETVRSLAAAVAIERGWPETWLNDGVKGFLSARDGDPGMKVLSQEFPSALAPGLRIFIPRPEYLFAMKCRAMRLGGAAENRDIEDIVQLANEIGVTTAEDALDLVASFYPNAQLQPKVQFGLEEIFPARHGTGLDGGPPRQQAIDFEGRRPAHDQWR